MSPPKTTEPTPTPDPAPAPLPSPGPRTPGAARRRFSRPWMYRWVDSAGAGDSVADACKAAGVSHRDYHDGRRSDPAFDEECRVHDHALDLRICETVRRGALGGDTRSQSLYYGHVRELIVAAAGGDELGEAPLPPGVAEAMIRAGLLSAGHPDHAPPDDPRFRLPPPPAPHARPAAPRPRKRRKSRARRPGNGGGSAMNP